MKIGINGFGRIGRCLFRMGQDKDLDIVAINSPSPTQTSAHLLKYDSLYGIYDKEVSFQKDSITVNGKKTAYTSYRSPEDIPWSQWGVNLVLECSGVFKTREQLEKHLKGTVKTVYVAAPVSGDDFTLIYGINHTSCELKKHHIISNGSCTTNCLVPVIKVLNDNFKLQELMFTTVHSYTLDQNLLDSSHKKDLRRARAATLSMIPTTTGATGVLSRIFPELKGRMSGMAIRVPTPNVSLVDLVFSSRIKANAKEINKAFISAQNGYLKNILNCEEKELVSIDFKGSTYSCIVDLPSTIVSQEEGSMAKILAWYDNEIGFSKRMIDFIKYLLKQ